MSFGVIIRFYGGMILVGVLLIAWRGAGPAFDPLNILGDHVYLALPGAVAFIGLVVSLSDWAHKRFPSVQRCVRMMRDVFGDLSMGKILVLALLSGVGEELFFRGWLLNETGLWISSLIFGMVHLPPNRDWFYWPVFAFLVGIVAGLFCLWTDTLIWAVLIHVGINYFNLRGLVRG